jgi:hypothetical protein
MENTLNPELKFAFESGIRDAINKGDGPEAMAWITQLINYRNFSVDITPSPNQSYDPQKVHKAPVMPPN